MPLPKLPTRPAAILDVGEIELDFQAVATAPKEMQPELEGIAVVHPAHAAVGDARAGCTTAIPSSSGCISFGAVATA